MKKNFSNDEIINIFNTFGHKFNVRINKAGNIELRDVTLTRNDLERFVLYLTPSHRYLWRRFNSAHIGYYDTYCYPLNMKNRKDFDSYEYEWDGKKYTNNHYNYSRHAEFNTVDEAIEYFKMYCMKYKKIIL